MQSKELGFIIGMIFMLFIGIMTAFSNVFFTDELLKGAIIFIGLGLVFSSIIITLVKALSGA